MALITSAAVLLAVGAFALVWSAFGHRILRLMKIDFPSDAEHLLCCAALGTICLEVLLFFVQMSNHIRAGVVGVLLLAVLIGIMDHGYV